MCKTFTMDNSKSIGKNRKQRNIKYNSFISFDVYWFVANFVETKKIHLFKFCCLQICDIKKMGKCFSRIKFALNFPVTKIRTENGYLSFNVGRAWELKVNCSE